MFFRDRAFWASVVVAWTVIGFLVVGGWWAEAQGWLAFLERWLATTATVYAVHMMAYVTIREAVADAKGVER